MANEIALKTKYREISTLIKSCFDSSVHTYTLFGKDLKRKVARNLKRERILTLVLVSIRTHVLGEILPLAFGPTQKYHLDEAWPSRPKVSWISKIIQPLQPMSKCRRHWRHPNRSFPSLSTFSSHYSSRLISRCIGNPQSK